MIDKTVEIAPEFAETLVAIYEALVLAANEMRDTHTTAHLERILTEIGNILCSNALPSPHRMQVNVTVKRSVWDDNNKTLTEVPT